MAKKRKASSGAKHGKSAKHHKKGSSQKSHEHHEKPARHVKKKQDNRLWKIGLGLIGIIIVIGLFTNWFNFQNGKETGKETSSQESQVVASQGAAGETSEKGSTASAEASGEKVKLEFYVMSQCPYGTQVEDAIKPVLDEMGDSIDFSINYIANDNGDGTFRSLHGENEVNGNIVQLCAMKYNPDKYMDLIVCMNKNARAIPDNWEQCAKDNGLNVEKIRACYEGEEGKQLLSESIKKSEAVNARGSPTMFLNGKPYQSGRDTLSFRRAVCNELGGQHEACQNLPECGSDADCTAEPGKIGKCINPNQDNAKCEYSDPVKVKFTVINDKTCSSCDTTRIVQVTKQLFPGVEVEYRDYSDPDAKSLLEEVGVKLLPAYIFDSNVVKAARYGQVARALVKAGDKYYIAPSAAGSNYNPDIPEIPKKLDLYVMSQCPFGSQAVQSMQEVLDLFGNQIDFNLHYIANDNGDGTFQSLHGQPEVEEDIRQLCAMEKFPDKAFDYIVCIAKDYRNAPSIWENCADEAGIDKDALRECAEGEEGKKLLSEDVKNANDLGIGSSPTFIINNKNRMSGAQPADTIKSALCQANPDLDGCDETLSQASAQTTVTQGAGCGA